LLSDEILSAIRHELTEILHSEISDFIFTELIDSILLTSLPTCDLLPIAANYASAGNSWRALELLSGIVPHIDAAIVFHNLPLFLELSGSAFESGVPRLILPALGLFLGVLTVLQTVEPLMSHIPLIINLAGGADSFFDENSLHRAYALLENILYTGDQYGLRETDICEIVSGTVRAGTFPLRCVRRRSTSRREFSKSCPRRPFPSFCTSALKSGLR
jgi:hypothetical protein